MNLTLIGYRGTGKTTAGKLLAERIGWSFVDTDVLIVQRAQKTIKEIFAAEGEAGFRDRESAVITDVCARNNTVISAGGGAILRPQNVAAMKNAGPVVWLQADADTLWQRISADAATTANRPNLTAAGGVAEIKELLAKRTPLYAAAANHTLDVATLSVEEVVAALMKIARPSR